MKYLLFLTWVLILLIELFSFYIKIHSPYDVSEVIFHVTLIVVTLVVGATGIFVSKQKL